MSTTSDRRFKVHPISAVSGVIPQVKPLAYWNKLLNMPWVSYRFFRSCCCSEHMFDGPLERHRVGECGATTGYGQRKEQWIFWWYESQSLRSFCRLIDSEIMRAFKHPEDSHALLLASGCLPRCPDPPTIFIHLCLSTVPTFWLQRCLLCNYQLYDFEADNDIKHLSTGMTK